MLERLCENVLERLEEVGRGLVMLCEDGVGWVNLSEVGKSWLSFCEAA